MGLTLLNIWNTVVPEGGRHEKKIGILFRNESQRNRGIPQKRG